MIRTIQRRTRDALVLILIVPLVLGGLAIWTAHRYRENIAWVSHTKDVLALINGVLLSVTSAESSQRGLLLTGEKPFFESYLGAIRQIPEKLTKFRHLTADNPAQQRNVERLSALVNARIEKLNRVIVLWKSGSRQADQVSPLIESGRTSMASIGELCSSMEAEESRLLSNRIAAERAGELEVGICFGLGLAVNIALLYWAYRLIQQYGLSRDAAEAEIRNLNASLEKRVQERTAELEIANASLNRSNADLTSFAYIASHDLQEPLRTVGSFAGLLKRRYEGRLDAKADEYIHFMVEGTRRMQALVQDLLAYSQAGTQGLEMAEVDIQSVVEEAKENLAATITERKAQILSIGLPTAQGDPKKLILVFQNLLSNALKFSKPSQAPVIRIQAQKQDDQWVFSVADNGIGFDPAYGEKIFAMFQRLHHVGAYKGTGIGLAICKRIIEGHGGRIWANSEPLAGSTFWFTLPVNPRVNGTSRRQEHA